MTEPSNPPTTPIKSRDSAADDLRAEAKRRGVKPNEFASSILDAVTVHNLFLAVLDC